MFDQGLNPRPLAVLDLFCGLKGFSRAFAERAVVPHGLSLFICEAVEKAVAAGITAPRARALEEFV